MWILNIDKKARQSKFSDFRKHNQPSDKQRGNEDQTSTPVLD